MLKEKRLIRTGTILGSLADMTDLLRTRRLIIRRTVMYPETVTLLHLGQLNMTDRHMVDHQDHQDHQGLPLTITMAHHHHHHLMDIHQVLLLLQVPQVLRSTTMVLHHHLLLMVILQALHHHMDILRVLLLMAQSTTQRDRECQAKGIRHSINIIVIILTSST
jgi:hypothetical protein